MNALRNPDGAFAEKPENRPQFIAMPFSGEPRRSLSRSFYKKEVAAWYCISVKTLRSYIDTFLPRFTAIGYRRDMQKLTPKMVELLFELIGEA